MAYKNVEKRKAQPKRSIVQPVRTTNSGCGSITSCCENIEKEQRKPFFMTRPPR